MSRARSTASAFVTIATTGRGRRAARRSSASSRGDEPVARPDPLVGRQAEADHVDLEQGLAHQVVEPLAEQRARAVQAGGVDEHELRVGPVHDAADRCAGWSAACST